MFEFAPAILLEPERVTERELSCCANTGCWCRRYDTTIEEDTVHELFETVAGKNCAFIRRGKSNHEHWLIMIKKTCSIGLTDDDVFGYDSTSSDEAGNLLYYLENMA